MDGVILEQWLHNKAEALSFFFSNFILSPSSSCDHIFCLYSSIEEVTIIVVASVPVGVAIFPSFLMPLDVLGGRVISAYPFQDCYGNYLRRRLTRENSRVNTALLKPFTLCRSLRWHSYLLDSNVVTGEALIALVMMLVLMTLLIGSKRPGDISAIGVDGEWVSVSPF